MKLTVGMVTPAPAGSRKGNRVTALRWARALRALGHRVRLAESWGGDEVDVLVALHARRSAPSVDRFRARHPSRPLVVALTGTDVYQDLGRAHDALRSLEQASRIIALQPLAAAALPEALRARARVILQSASRALVPPAPPVEEGRLEVLVLAHLREVKDPLRAALAARLLPASSCVHVTHLGAALDEALAAAAQAESQANPRYRWLGEAGRQEGLARLARSHLLVVSSRLEGGANVVSEAIVAGVPVVASRIPGSVGLLGEEYPGYFPVGDTAALAALLARCEGEPRFLRRLAYETARLRPLFDPARERDAWRALLHELFPARTD
jgi:putative glycosyltransferase (TIGR04348 family)